MKRILLVLAVLLVPARAQDTGDVFTGLPDGAKTHIASGFVCPLKIDGFERDAVGEKDPSVHADYCAYSALDSVYGTITLTPLGKTYDPKAMLSPDFAVQEGSGARMLGETIQTLHIKNQPLAVYERTYETARLEALKYESLFASAVVGAWVVEVEVEYAAPRDTDERDTFLNAVYGDALKTLGPAQ